jgi:hypothetical protein
VCWADIADDARQIKQKTAADFYRALRALGHRSTVQERADLVAKIYAPGVIQAEQMIQKQTDEIRKGIRAQLKKDLQDAERTREILNSLPVPSGLGALGQAAYSSAASSTRGPAARMPNAVAPVLPSLPAPEVVIDGSQFPQVLEFSGGCTQPSAHCQKSPLKGR